MWDSESLELLLEILDNWGSKKDFMVIKWNIISRNSRIYKDISTKTRQDSRFQNFQEGIFLVSNQ